MTQFDKIHTMFTCFLLHFKPIHLRKIFSQKICLRNFFKTFIRSAVQTWNKVVESGAVLLHPTRLDSFHLHWPAGLSHALQPSALHFTAGLSHALQPSALQFDALLSTALQYTALQCTALHCNALHCTALHCTALNCAALHCIAGGKSNGKKWSQIWTFLFENCLKSPRKKKFFFFTFFGLLVFGLF